jgi:capsid protein
MSILSRVFPRQVAAIRKEAATQGATAARGIMARALAGFGGGMFFGQKWHNGLSSSSPSLTVDHARLREQGRLMEQHSLQARSIIDTEVNSVVDSGLVCVPEPMAEQLGLTDEAAEEWGEKTGKAFDLYMQSKRCTRSELQNGYQAQRLIWRGRARDNDSFVRHYYSKDPTLLNPLQFEVLDPDQFRADAFTTTSGGLKGLYDDGIDRDAAGREVGYRVWTQDPTNGMISSVTIPRYGPKSNRIFMTHGFEPMYAGQGRGFSEFGVSVQDLELILDLSLAHIKKAINQSNLYLVAENMQGDTVDPLKDFGGGDAGPTGAETEDLVSEEDRELLRPLYAPISEVNLDTPGSTGIFNSPQGQVLKPFINTAPADSYNAFVDAYFAYIAAAKGTSIEMVLRKFGASYNANRVTLTLCYRIAVQRRYALACDHLDPIYESWLSEEIAAGRISCPGWQDPRLRAAWLYHRWQGLPMPDMDPVKTFTAAKMAVELGAEDLDEIATNTNGSSGKANRRKLRRQYAELPEPAWGWPKSGGASEPKQAAGQDDGTDGQKPDQGGNE